MKQFFYCIQDALDCMPKCLVCSTHLGLESMNAGHSSHLQIEFDNYGRGGYYPLLTYTMVDSGYEDIYRISTTSSIVTRDVKIRTNDCVVGSFSGATRYTGSSSSPPISGHRYLYLGVDCKKCRKYDYVLQLIISIEPLAVERIVLNSERVIFQENDERRELKNIYTTKQTIYSYFPKAKLGTLVTEMKQDFPLLPLDRKDPTKTLNRVKNLLIFT